MKGHHCFVMGQWVIIMGQDNRNCTGNYSQRTDEHFGKRVEHYDGNVDHNDCHSSKLKGQ